MESANYRKHAVRAEEREATLARPTWWPLFILLAVFGSFFREAWHPLPLIFAPVVGLVVGLLFSGIALWLIHYLSE